MLGCKCYKFSVFYGVNEYFRLVSDFPFPALRGQHGSDCQPLFSDVLIICLKNARWALITMRWDGFLEGHAQSVVLGTLQ